MKDNKFKHNIAGHFLGSLYQTSYIYIYIYINILRGKKDATTFPDKPVS